MPHGFTSPKTLKKTDLNKKEIKEVVKSYFDKPPGTQPMTPFAATQEQFFSTQNGFSSNK